MEVLVVRRTHVYIVLLVVSLGFIGMVAYQAFLPSITDYRKQLLLSRGANQNDPGYQRLLAEQMYDKGDFESALKWELRSAEGGDPLAQNFMGYYFRYGINDSLKPASLDYGRAREWFETAAAQAFPPSQEELCEIYSKGLGVTPDHEVGYFWCSLSGSTERATRLRQLSHDALDKESQQRVERRVAAWIETHRQNH